MKVKRSVGKRGQVTLPKRIREELGLLPNSEVLFSVDGDKVVIESEDESFVEFAEQISKEIGELDKSIKEYRDEQIRSRL